MTKIVKYREEDRFRQPVQDKQDENVREEPPYLNGMEEAACSTGQNSQTNGANRIQYDQCCKTLCHEPARWFKVSGSTNGD